MEFLASLAVKALIGTSICGGVTVGTIYTCDRTLLGFAPSDTSTNTGTSEQGAPAASNGRIVEGSRIGVVELTPNVVPDTGKTTSVDNDTEREDSKETILTANNGAVREEETSDSKTPQTQRDNADQSKSLVSVLVDAEVSPLNVAAKGQQEEDANGAQVDDEVPKATDVVVPVVSTTEVPSQGGTNATFDVLPKISSPNNSGTLPTLSTTGTDSVP